MHHITIDSYKCWLENSPNLQQKNLHCIDPNKPPNSSTAWLLQTIDSIAPTLDILFPKMEVYYLLEHEEECNARVLKFLDGHARIVVTDKCGEFFLTWANGLHVGLLQVIDAESEKALLQTLVETRKSANLKVVKSLGADIYSVCAVACLLGHELGHVHEKHFDPSFKTQAEEDGRWALIKHGKEFAADFWSVWTAADFLRPLINIALEEAWRDEEKLACQHLLSTLALAAFACIDPIWFSDKWGAENPKDMNDTHPAAAARLMSAAVSLTDWWIKRGGVDSVSVASPICVTALQRILALSQSDNADVSTLSDAELLRDLLNKYDEAQKYMELVREVYPQVNQD